MKKLLKPPKAYKNLEFLNSPDARIIRMLSEFIEPQRRFRSESVRNTVVFFGSARLKARADARRELASAKKAASSESRHSRALGARIREAERDVLMSRYYEDCVELARLVTAWSQTLPNPNSFVVCSGGGPGIMEAANRGAHMAGGKSIGMNISLPFEQFANPYITKGLNFEFHYFFMRKFWFVYLAKALVVFPGGFGTMDELFELLTLLQSDKIKKKVAVVVYGSEYWNRVVNFDAMVEHGVISRRDLRLFRFIDTPEEAFEHLQRFLVRQYGGKGVRIGS